MDKDQANEKVDLPPVKFILVQTIDRQGMFIPPDNEMLRV